MILELRNTRRLCSLLAVVSYGGSSQKLKTVTWHFVHVISFCHALRYTGITVFVFLLFFCSRPGESRISFTYSSSSLFACHRPVRTKWVK